MKEKWQSIRGFFRKNSRKLIPLLLLAAILLPIVVDNSYVLGICTKILLYMLLASSVNVINGYSGQFAIGHAGFLCVGAYTAAILMARANVPFFLAMLGAGVMTALFGMLVSFPIGKLSGIYALIIIGMMWLRPQGIAGSSDSVLVSGGSKKGRARRRTAHPKPVQPETEKEG